MDTPEQDAGSRKPPAPRWTGRREPLIRRRGDLALLALALGIVSICAAYVGMVCCPIYCFVVPMAVSGVVIGWKERESYRRDIALVALILNALSLVIGLGIFLLLTGMEFFQALMSGF